MPAQWQVTKMDSKALLYITIILNEKYQKKIN